MDKLRQDMEQQWQQSASLVGKHLRAGDVSCRLFEHEYGVELHDGRLEAAIAEASHWIESFLNWTEDMGLGKAIRTARRCWIEPEAFGPRAPGFHLDGQQVLVKVDLALRTTQEIFEIWDWKTGRLRERNPRRIDPAALQVNVYQLWPHLQLGIPLESIRAHLVYVAQPSVEDIVYEIDADVREYVLSLVRRSVDRVRHFSGRATDVELTVEDFDFASSPGLCRSCNFKRICLRNVGQEV